MTIKLGENEKRVRLNIFGQVEEVPQDVPVEVTPVEEKPVEEPAVVSADAPVLELDVPVVEEPKKPVRRGRRRK